MTATTALVTTALLSLLGLVSVLFGLRVFADPRIPNDWRTWLAPIGIAMVVFGAGTAIATAWRLT